ncbi:uncharacterized protein LOC129599469 [Paramacrobiotus metropolitanus]|uniref:uncharacterized protein LOC129599469 n=1 Tax=Paramacrobiotus metropolitanus TaxID=2943436 RepID=UPI002445E59D|nr:uncharacterized protein LOC129599469 [Paramacrobiotus metropolitanus]XP_055353680.1 uncharacterized protein LOC129599469 [Paramacrobiotus metropolitanus]
MEKCAVKPATRYNRHRKKRLRKILRTFSSEAFQLSPMPSLSQLTIGPNLLALGRVGMTPQPVKLTITRHREKPSSTTKKTPLREAFDRYGDPSFMEEFMEAEYFLAHIHSFMLNCDMLRGRKDEVRKRKEYLEKEKETIVQELYKTTHQLHDAVNLELDCKKVLAVGKRSLEEASKLYDQIENQAFKLYGSKAFRSPKEQVSSEIFQDELRGIFSANMPPD